MGLNFAAGGYLPLESHWRINLGSTPLPFERNSIAEYGRWIGGGSRGVSIQLIYVATLVAQARAKEYCLCELQDSAARLLQLLGIELHSIKCAELLIDSVPPGGRTYYEGAPVGLNMMKLSQIYQACLARLSPLTSFEVSFESG
jgi:hypothetical protein